MINHDDDPSELLEAAKQAVVHATAANARTARAGLSGALRKVRTDANETTARLSEEALAASEFLRDLAWLAESADPAAVARQRETFALAMDHLIYETGITSLRPQRRQQETAVAQRPSRIGVLLARTKVAETVSRWARKSQRVSRSTPSQPRREPSFALEQHPGHRNLPE